MSAFTRMMEDYDYHEHTGELPEYFGGNDNRGCGFGCFVAVVLFAGLVYSTCSSDRKEEKQDVHNTKYVTVPAYNYQTPYYPTEASPSSVTSEEPIEQPTSVEPIQEQKQEQVPAQPVQQVKISRYYQEGYDKGYDDGEDDAVMDNGWGGQYDDECRYTGKKRKDYQLGYEEGYEAGYYDNKDSDE